MWLAVDYDAFNLYFKGTVQGNQHKISGTFERVVSNTLAGRIVARSSVFFLRLSSRLLKPSCFLFWQCLNSNNYLPFNCLASDHSLKIKCGPQNL